MEEDIQSDPRLGPPVELTLYMLGQKWVNKIKGYNLPVLYEYSISNLRPLAKINFFAVR